MFLVFGGLIFQIVVVTLHLCVHFGGSLPPEKLPLTYRIVFCYGLRTNNRLFILLSQVTICFYRSICWLLLVLWLTNVFILHCCIFQILGCRGLYLTIDLIYGVRVSQ